MLTPIQVVGNLRLIKGGIRGGNWSKTANTFQRDITTNVRYRFILFDLCEQAISWKRQGSSALRAAMPALYEKLVDVKVFSADGRFLAQPFLKMLVQVCGDTKSLERLGIPVPPPKLPSQEHAGDRAIQHARSAAAGKGVAGHR